MKSQEKAISEAVQKAHQKGFYSFTDRAGRERTVEPHIRTIVKTTAFRTYREMREKPADDLGIDTFLYSSKSATRELCAPLQNKIVTKGVARVEKGQKVLSLADYGYGKANGCQGINCGHYMTPFIIGINEIPKISDEDNLSEEELVRNANAQAKQRAFEREIRKSKELINISKIVNDKELEQKHRLRVKTLQSGLKQHIEKNPFLYRESARERYKKGGEKQGKLYKSIDKKLKIEYSEILQNLGNKAPKSYNDYVSLSKDKKDLLKHDYRIVKYFKGDIREELSEKQKKQAVEAYFSFKKDGIIFGDHAIARYIERMRRKNGTIIYNYETVKKGLSKKLIMYLKEMVDLLGITIIFFISQTLKQV